MLRAPLARLILAALVLAAAPMPPAVSPAWASAAETDDAKTIARVERYLNAITTLRADFIQVADDGSTAKGVIYISRPGRLRVQYALPSRVVMVSNGGWLTYIDGSVGQLSQIPLDRTPAGILVAKNIRLGGAIEVDGIEHAAQVTRITLRRAASPAEGSITLTFTDRPFELRQWTVIDPQGFQTRTTLYNLREGVAIDPKLFDAPPPIPESELGR